MNSAAAPAFDGPIRESQPTVAPREDVDHLSAEGYRASKVAAERVLLDSGHPVTVQRPSRVHGVGTTKPDEWVFVKRVLDRRRVVLLARGGRGVDQTSAAANIAALIEVVAGRPGARVLNGADPDAPSALEISRIVAAHFGHEWREVLLDEHEHAPAGLGLAPLGPGSGDPAGHGRGPAAGLRTAGDYAATVTAELDWLAAADRLPPGFDHDYFAPMLDYAAEDAYVVAR